MQKLSDLFDICCAGDYIVVGENTSYKFIEEKDTLYIYFQGSTEDTDWRDNFNFPAIPYKNIDVKFYVHRGFLKQWKAVEDIIIEKILEKSKDSLKWKKIIVVGYSLGGALAQFAAQLIWYHRPDLRKEGTVTLAIEAPRILFTGCICKLKKELRERWDNCYIFRDNKDLVTHCPPKILFGFDHPHSCIQIHGNRKLCPDKWVPNCIKDHYPQPVHDGLVKFETEFPGYIKL